jgi:hypothetical protein
VEAFDETLGPVTSRHVAQIADAGHQCANEEAGFGCEFSTRLVAYRRLGLMPRFVRFGCKVVKCEEAGICSRMPPGP